MRLRRVFFLQVRATSMGAANVVVPEFDCLVSSLQQVDYSIRFSFGSVRASCRTAGRVPADELQFFALFLCRSTWMAQRQRQT